MSVVVGTEMGLVGPVSVRYDWMRWRVWTGTSVCISVWQHIKLCEQIRLLDTFHPLPGSCAVIQPTSFTWAPSLRSPEFISPEPPSVSVCLSSCVFRCLSAYLSVFFFFLLLLLLLFVSFSSSSSWVCPMSCYMNQNDCTRSPVKERSSAHDKARLIFRFLVRTYCRLQQLLYKT